MKEETKNLKTWKVYQRPYFIYKTFFVVFENIQEVKTQKL